MARPRLDEQERRALELRLGAAELRELNRIGVRCYRTISNEIQNHWLICISLFLVNSASLQIGPERSRARSGEANLDGEDRSGIIQGEGKGGGCRRDLRSGALSSAPGGLFRAFPQG